MKVGFTGTRNGIGQGQRSQLRSWLEQNAVEEFHHGCCLGADEAAVDMVSLCCGPDAVIVAHPSDLAGMTSGRAVGQSEMAYLAKPPLERNRDIVDACDVLLACPEGPEEVRSGTWATVRYARKIGRCIVIFWPDGEVTEEDGVPN